MLLLGIIVFLLLSAFFSGSEIAFISSNKLGIEVLKNKGSKKGYVMAQFYDDPKSFISTMLVGNNISLVIFTLLMTQLLNTLIFGNPDDDSVLGLIINTLLITGVVLIFGEFLPKTLARIYSNDFLYWVAYPLRLFKWILKFPTWVMIGLTNFLLKYVFRTPIENATMALTRVDLEHFIDEELSQNDDEFDKEILVNALNLEQQKVRDCMIPRNEIVHVDKTDSLEDLLEEFKSSRLSRILISDGGVEQIVGYIHHQSLLERPKKMVSVMRDMPFVPETMNVRDLLYKFIKSGVGIACVVDEFGGTAGIITLEDILEEIFGEIEDEHDDVGLNEVQISDLEYVFDGRLEIDYLNEKYEHLDIPVGEYNTLSGYIVMTGGTIPEELAEVEIGDYRFILESVSDTKIESVRVVKIEQGGEE